MCRATAPQGRAQNVLAMVVKVAIVGHSLVPREFVCDTPGVEVLVFRKPGATWVDLNVREFSGFWGQNFDLVILMLGGNDLCLAEAYPVLCKCKEFVRAALQCANHVRVCSVESRDYDLQSRFDITTSEFNVRRRRYNRMTRRWVRRIGHLFIDIGKPRITSERTRDGVHFNEVANQLIVRLFNRVIRGFVQS